MSFFFQRSTPNASGRCMIGVTQTQHGVGATHFCLAYSIYFSQILKKKTVVISMGHSIALETLEKHCLGCSEPEYSLQGVDFINDCTTERLTRLFLMNYDILIIDFGVYHSSVENLFCSCNLRLLIGSLVEWREPDYALMLEQGGFLSDAHCIFLALFASEDQRRRFRRKYGVRVHNIPFEPDPFLISRENLSFYDLIYSGRFSGLQ